MHPACGHGLHESLRAGLRNGTQVVDQLLRFAHAHRHIFDSRGPWGRKVHRASMTERRKVASECWLISGGITPTFLQQNWPHTNHMHQNGLILPFEMLRSRGPPQTFLQQILWHRGPAVGEGQATPNSMFPSGRHSTLTVLASIAHLSLCHEFINSIIDCTACRNGHSMSAVFACQLPRMLAFEFTKLTRLVG